MSQVSWLRNDIMNNMELFRGDKIHNGKTKPGLYRGNGLRSKSFGSGTNPANIEVIGLLETIRKHIKPTGADFQYYDVTDYLSFSKNQERAYYWCSDMGTITLERCREYEETRYIFKMTLEDVFIQELCNGIYLYHYACNPGLQTSDSNSEHRLILESIFSYKVCPQCRNENRNHSMILINSYEYLKCHINHEGYDGAIKFAQQDEEWLVLPYDNFEDTNFRKARIPRADFWAVEHFKVFGEARPNMEVYL